jgi:integrase
MKSNQLTTRKVATAKAAGHYYGDGGGLYLQVSAYGTRSWVYRYTIAGARREMGLGSLDTFTLKEARERARECRQLVNKGIDPIDDRRAKRDVRRAEAAKRLTFKDAAEKYIAAHASEWRSQVHLVQWRSSLKTYAYPVLGQMPVDAIALPHVIKVLEPIWQTKTETASRLRARIERVLAWATVSKFRTGDNPATWRGNLKEALAAPSKIKKIRHHPALPYVEIPAFMEELRASDGVAARALEFTILTAARTSEITGATWDEIDLARKVWTVPAGRIKGGKEHRVPLSGRCVDILESLPRTGDLMFPGLIRKSMSVALRSLRDGLTVHGFRSSFRDWAAERTAYPQEVIEQALAHKLEDAAEAAYARWDMLKKHARLMQDWSGYCSSPVVEGPVVAFNTQDAWSR